MVVNLLMKIHQNATMRKWRLRDYASIAKRRSWHNALERVLLHQLIFKLIFNSYKYLMIIFTHLLRVFSICEKVELTWFDQTYFDKPKAINKSTETAPTPRPAPMIAHFTFGSRPSSSLLLPVIGWEVKTVGCVENVSAISVDGDCGTVGATASPVSSEIHTS